MVNYQLKFGLSDSEIMKRFENYGPVARIVLETNTQIFEEQEEGILQRLEKIVSWKQVVPYFSHSLIQFQSSEDLIHRLLKIEPDDIVSANFI